jgi:hypothetical protein
VTEPEEPEPSKNRWLLWVIVGGPILVYAIGRWLVAMNR